MRYGLSFEMEADEEAIRKLRDEAGCFVLITNTPREGAGAHEPKELLTIYKGPAHGGEQLRFLKGSRLCQRLFLKSPEHIEALGLILVLALMIWRLMERTMRANLAAHKSKITGWVNRQTSRPPPFMMTTKFSGIFVLKEGKARRLSKTSLRCSSAISKSLTSNRTSFSILHDNEKKEGRENYEISRAEAVECETERSNRHHFRTAPLVNK